MLRDHPHIMLIALCLAGMLARAAHAQTPEGDPTNAATWYRAAYLEYRSVKFDMDLYDHAAAFESDPDRGPSPDARKYLNRYRQAVNLTKRAARREFCDFGPYDQLGEDETAYHVSHLRALAFALRDDYLLRVFDGDLHEAIDDVCLEFRIARHAASQSGVLPVLVGAALLTFTDNLIKQAIDHGLIGPSEATRLLRELDKFKGDDPLGFREAMIHEYGAMTDKLAKRYADAEGVQRFRDDHLPYYRQEEDQEAIDALQQLSRASLDELLAGLRNLQERLLAAMHEETETHTLAALKSIDDEVKSGLRGRMAQNYLGHASRTLIEMQRTRKTLEDRRAILQGIATGATDPMSLANAACWYIRAGIRMEQIDPAALNVIDEQAAQHDPNAGANAGLSDALARKDVGEVLQLLATAATIERCDFTYAADDMTITHRAYHAGLLACGRLLAADAARLMRIGHVEEATSRVVQMYRMSEALSGDGCIAGSLAGHRIFVDADALTARLIDDGALPQSKLELMQAALSRFSRGDPFHYQPAIGGMRERVRGWIVWLVQGAPPIRPRPNGRLPAPEQKFIDEADAIVSQCDADRVMALMVASEGRYIVDGKSRTPPRPPIEGLWPIFDVEALQRSRDTLPVLLQWARMHVIAGVPQTDLPVIAPIEARSKQSIEDFRACLRRLGVNNADTPTTQSQ